MAKQVEISMEGVQRLLEQIQGYFQNLDLYQKISWGAIGLGVMLIVVAVIVW